MPAGAWLIPYPHSSLARCPKPILRRQARGLESLILSEVEVTHGTPSATAKVRHAHVAVSRAGIVLADLRHPRELFASDASLNRSAGRDLAAKG